MKIFRQQLVETKVAISSLFIGAFANIMPYFNAFLMAIKEISKAIATMFGIKLKDYNSGIASQEGIYDGIADSADGASKAVKELKRQTLGFDEIHNINENKDSGSGSVGGVSGGIDQRLLDAIKGYDNGMESVRMKASQIRDDIMKWLGFTKEIDPLTGEVSFKYQGIKTTLKNMWDSFKGLSTQGKILVGLGLVTGALKLYSAGKKLVNVFGSSGLVKVTKSLISPMSSLFGWMKTGIQVNGKLTSGLKDGIQAWREQNILVTKADGSLNKWKTTMNGAKIAVQGLITSAVGLYTVHESMKNLSTEGVNLVNILGLLGGSLTTIASGVQIGSIFGGWGTAIGGTIATISTLIDMLLSYENQGYRTADSIIASTKATNEYSNSLLKQYDAIAESLNQESALTTAHSNLLDELNSIVDANGNVKKGYEERANFIITTLNQAYGTEMSIVDGKIQKMDEEILKIRDVIAEKKKEIALESASQAYKIALSEKAKTYQNLETAIKKYNNALTEQERYENELKSSYDKYKDSYYKQYETYERFLEAMSKSEKGYKNIIKATDEAKNAMDNATIAYDANTTAIMQYQGLLSADAQENAELVDYYMTQIENTYYDGEKTIKLTYEQQIKDAQEYYESVIRTSKENGQKITDEVKSQANSRLNIVTKNLIDQSQTVSGLTPQVAQAWSMLANTNKEAYKTALSKLPDDVRNQLGLLENSVNNSLGYGSKVYGAFGAVGASLGKNLGNSISDNIKINGNTLNSTWNRATTSIQKKLADLGGVLGAGLGINLHINGYANGGMPEDGLFFANHNELIGKFSNGRTAVANNEMIIDGIKAGVYEAVVMAMSQYGGGGIAEINVRADEGIIVETAINGINQKTRQTGICPVDIPTY
ncbi:MAG: hypothetical protein V8Q75_03230 [Bacilli bacterium]